jgi:hypothetical protein
MGIAGLAGSLQTLATTYKITEHGVITHTAFSGSLRPSRQMLEYSVHDAFRVMDSYQCHPTCRSHAQHVHFLHNNNRDVGNLMQ